MTADYNRLQIKTRFLAKELIIVVLDQLERRLFMS